MPRLFTKSPNRSRTNSEGREPEPNDGNENRENVNPEVGPSNAEGDVPPPRSNASSANNSRRNSQSSPDNESFRQTFAWLQEVSDKVQACENLALGRIFVNSLARQYGQTELTDEDVLEIEDMCEAYVEKDMAEKNEFKEFMAKEILAKTLEVKQDAEEKARNLILNSQKERLFHSEKEDSDLLPPAHFAETYNVDGVDGFAKIEKAFKPSNGKLFNGDRSFPVEIYLSKMTATQEVIKLDEKLFIKMLLTTTSGPAHNTIQAHAACGKSVASIYHILGKIYDLRITSHEAREKLNKYRANKHKSLHNLLDDIMVLTTRSCKDFPLDGRQGQFDSMALEALLRALPQKSNERTREIYAEVAAALNRTPSYEEICLAIEKYDKLYRQDIAQYGSDNLADANIYRETNNRFSKRDNYSGRLDSSKLGKGFGRQVNQVSRFGEPSQNHQEFSQRGRQIDRSREPNSRNTVLQMRRAQVGYQQPIQGRSNYSNRSHSSQEQVAATNRQVRSLQGNYPMSRNQHFQGNNRQSTPGGNFNYQDRRNQSYRSNFSNGNSPRSNQAFNGNRQMSSSNQNNYQNKDRNFSKCTVCGGTNHLADTCFASFTDSGAHIALTPTTAPCKTCQDVFHKELLHQPKICPWRVSARNLYEAGTVKPIGIYKEKLKTSRNI